MNKIIWQSTITKDMINDETDLEELCRELDKAVEDICSFYGIN